MIRPDYRDYRRITLRHSAEGSTWKDHKYIKRINGTYYYPKSYEGGRHLPEGVETSRGEPNEIESLDSSDVEALAKEVIRGNFANGQERKELLGAHYEEVQKRVNELIKTYGSTKIPDDTSSYSNIAEEAAKKAVALVKAHRAKN